MHSHTTHLNIHSHTSHAHACECTHTHHTLTNIHALNHLHLYIHACTHHILAHACTHTYLTHMTHLHMHALIHHTLAHAYMHSPHICTCTHTSHTHAGKCTHAHHTLACPHITHLQYTHSHAGTPVPSGNPYPWHRGSSLEWGCGEWAPFVLTKAALPGFRVRGKRSQQNGLILTNCFRRRV